jgi:cell division protein FtsL
MKLQSMENLFEIIPKIENAVHASGLNQIQLFGLLFLFTSIFIFATREVFLWFFKIRFIESELTAIQQELRRSRDSLDKLTQQINELTQRESAQPIVKNKNFNLSH